MRYLIAAALAFMAVTASAQEAGTGGYVGFGIGSLDYEQDIFSDSASAYRIFGGYDFNEHFAVEGGWGTTDDIGVSESFAGMTMSVKSDFEVMTVRALAKLPLSKVRLFGGVGYYDADMNTTVTFSDSGGTTSISGTDSDSGSTVIAGIEFDISRLKLRGEYEWFDTDDGVDASILGVGLSFAF